MITPINIRQTEREKSPSSVLTTTKQQNERQILVELWCENNAQIFSETVFMSQHRYNLRSTESIPSHVTTEEDFSASDTSSSSSGDTPRDQVLPPLPPQVSPYFTGVVPIFYQVRMMADDAAAAAAADAAQLADADQINVVGGSQDNIDLNGQMHDGQGLLGEHVNVDVTVQDGSAQEALNVVADEHKRNKVNSLLAIIKEGVDTLKEELLDQITPSIINDDFRDLVDMVKTYNNVIGNVLDVPEHESWEAELRDFVAVHRVEYKALNKEINALKLRVKRLTTFENVKHSNTRAPIATGAGGPGHSTTLKLPRIQIPRFEDNVSGSVNWDNFRNMMVKLTLGMDPQEKIFILKSALTGESAKLVANEQSYDQAMSMLTSVYGNELLQLQSKIQEFIGLVHQEALEKIKQQAIEHCGKSSSCSQIFLINKSKSKNHLWS